MSFKLGDIIWDRLQYGFAEALDTTGTPLYVLTQLQEATINVTAESKDVLDKDGNLIKKIWKSKAGTLEATNAMINTNIIAAASGLDPVFAREDGKIKMPAIKTVKKGQKLVLKDFVTGTVRLNEFFGNGSLGEAFELAEEAAEKKFAVDEGGNLTLPTGEGVEQYIVRYDRDVSDGVMIQNRIDKFPKAVRLILKGLYFDPCEKNVLKPGYIELPSFQVSPEVSIPIQTEATLDYKGDLEIDYCGTEKVLYNMYLPNESEEDE